MQGIGFARPRLLTRQEQLPESELLAVVNAYRHYDGASVLVELKSWNRCEVDVAVISVKLPQPVKPLTYSGVVELAACGDMERLF
jgi:hypothetical protein